MQKDMRWIRRLFCRTVDTFLLGKAVILLLVRFLTASAVRHIIRLLNVRQLLLLIIVTQIRREAAISTVEFLLLSLRHTILLARLAHIVSLSFIGRVCL